MRPTRDLSLPMLCHLGMMITPRMDLMALRRPQNVDETLLILRVMTKIVTDNDSNYFVQLSPPFIEIWTPNSDIDFNIKDWPEIVVSTIHNRPLCKIHPASFERWIREIDLSKLTSERSSIERQDEEMIAIAVADQSWL